MASIPYLTTRNPRNPRNRNPGVTGESGYGGFTVIPVIRVTAPAGKGRAAFVPDRRRGSKPSPPWSALRRVFGGR